VVLGQRVDGERLTIDAFLRFEGQAKINQEPEDAVELGVPKNWVV
jgi:hypothetical protein